MAQIVVPVVKFVSSLAVSYAIGYLFRPKPETEITAPRFSDNQVTTRSAVEPRAIVFGEHITTGPLVFGATSGSNNRFLNTIIPLCEGESEEIRAVYFDDLLAAAPEFNKIHIERIYFQVFDGKLNMHGQNLIIRDKNGNVLMEWREGELVLPGDNGSSHKRIKTMALMTARIVSLVQAHPAYPAAPFTVAGIDPTQYGNVTVEFRGKTLTDRFSVEAFVSGEVIDHYSQVVVAQVAEIFSLYYHLGAAGQLADANLVAEGVGWTDDHRLRGVTYIYPRLEYIEARWPFGIPNFKAVVRGQRVFDPRTSTTYWSNNLALCARHYLTSEFGLGVRSGGADTEIDEASFIAAANISDEYVLARPATNIVSSSVANPTVIESLGHGLFDEDEVVIAGHAGSTPSLDGNHAVTKVDDDHVSIPVAVTVAGTGGTIQLRQRRFTCDLRFTLDETPRAIMEKIKSAGQAQLIFSEGKYKFFVAAYTSPVMDLDEDDLRGPLTVTFRPARRDLLNAVRGKYVDKHRSWEETDFPEYRDVVYEAEDGGEKISRDATFAATTNVYAAQRLAKIMLERSRAAVVVFPAKLRALQLEVNDRVRVTVAHLGWSLKVFRVTATRYTEAGEVDLDLIEDDSAMYAWDPTDAVVVDPPPPTALPSPYTTDPPENLVVEEELYETTNGQGIQSRLVVSWDPSPDASAVGYYVHLQGEAAKPSPSAISQGRVTSPLITELAYKTPDLVPGIYLVSVVATDRNGTLSAELGPVEIEVFGKTAPPPDVTGFVCGQNGNVVVFRWDQVADIDLDGYDIRYGPIGSSWADGTPLTEIEKGTHVTSASVPPGSWRTMIKAKDTVGNYSVTEGACDVEVANVLDIIVQVQQAPDWPGVLVNFVRHWTGVLIPDDQQLASAYADAQNTWATTFVPMPYALCTYEAPELDVGFDDDVRAWALIDSALGPGVTTGKADPKLELDYRLAADAYDGFEPWTIGEVRGRYFKHRLVLDTAVGKAKITGFLPTADQLERTESVDGVAIGSGGTTVSFLRAFHVVPNVVAVAVDTNPRFVVVSAVTTTGFFARVYNEAGVSVSGTINYDATGV